jgi:hypothetical protein
MFFSAWERGATDTLGARGGQSVPFSLWSQLLHINHGIANNSHDLLSPPHLKNNHGVLCEHSRPPREGTRRLLSNRHARFVIQRPGTSSLRNKPDNLFLGITLHNLHNYLVEHGTQDDPHKAIFDACSLQHSPQEQLCKRYLLTVTPLVSKYD